MWELLPWSGQRASGYPQRQCFFCNTSSIILPPYKPDEASNHGSRHPSEPQASQPNNIASSSNSIISTGTPTNWFCSSCHCQNVADQDGIPVEQYTRPMWDQDWNRDRSQLLRHTRPQAPSTAAESGMDSPARRAVFSGSATGRQERFAFCHTCQTNQILTLNMLADYLPSEDDPEYDEKLQHAAEYQASIAARYPSVCSECAPRVEERITERDQFARSWSLGKWLDLKKKASNADLVDSFTQAYPAKVGHPSKPNPNTNSQPIPSRALWSSIKGVISDALSLDSGSSLTMVLFVLINVGIWSLYVTTCLKPLIVASKLQATSRHIQTQPISVFTAVWILSVLLCLPALLTACCRMEPLKRSIEQARARQVRVEAKGLGLWHITQVGILVLRLFALFSTVYSIVQPEQLIVVLEWLESTTGRQANDPLRMVVLTMLIGEVGVTGLAASQLQIQSPSPLQLLSRPVVAPDRHGKSADVGADPLLTSLSLDDQAIRTSLFGSHTNGFAQQMVDTPMDDGTTLPPLQRDADGDAVMEDAAAYAARRMSQTSDEDAELDHWLAASRTSTSTWIRNWPKPSSEQPLHQPALASSSLRTTPGTGNSTRTQRSQIYSDFQLGPQRFWEPQNPTGLEDVFGRAVTLDDGPQNGSERNDDASGRWSKWFGFS